MLLFLFFGNNVFNDVMLGVKVVVDKVNYVFMIGDLIYIEFGEECIVEFYI